MVERSKVPLPLIVVARHGETEWSRSGQHTGRTDIPLTANGERGAKLLGERVRTMQFTHVWTSPLIRASKTAELAGFTSAEAVPDMMEWDYGEVEGLTTLTYWETNPGWDLYDDGCPGGEGMMDISARADTVIARLRAVEGDVLLFSHGHFLRVLAARWLGLDPKLASAFFLSTASVGILGYEHAISRPAIRLWNDTSHLTTMPT